MALRRLQTFSLQFVQDVINQIGMGPAQIFWGLLGGGVWLADGAELLLVSSVTRRAALQDVASKANKAPESTLGTALPARWHEVSAKRVASDTVHERHDRGFANSRGEVLCW